MQLGERRRLGRGKERDGKVNEVKRERERERERERGGERKSE